MDPRARAWIRKRPAQMCATGRVTYTFPPRMEMFEACAVQLVSLMRDAHVQTRRRGASMIEYMLLVAVVAIAGIAGFRAYSASVDGGNEALGGRVRNMQGSQVSAGPAIVASANGGPRANLLTGAPRIDPLTQNVGTAAGLRAEIPAGFLNLGGDDPEPAPRQDVNEGNYDWVRWSRIRGPAFIRNEGDRHAVNPGDVSQGQIGDCYLIAAMAAIAASNPGVLQSRITVRRDGFHEVRIFAGGRWTTSVMRDRFPVGPNGAPLYAQPGTRAERPELWPMLIERAYARVNGGFNAIGHGGDPGEALTALTGLPSEYAEPKVQTIEQLSRQLQSGQVVIVGTPEKSDLELFKNDTLATQHAYWVESVDLAAGTVTVRNPWGWDLAPITLSFEDYQKHFEVAISNPVTRGPRGRTTPMRSPRR